MNLRQGLKIAKRVLNDYANKSDPPRVIIVHTRPDGTIPKNAQDRVKSNPGGINIIMDAYTDKMDLKPNIGPDDDSD